MSKDTQEKTRMLTAQGIGMALIVSIVAEYLLPSLKGNVNYVIAITHVSIVFITIFLFHRFAHNSFRSYKPTLKDTVTMTSVLCGTILMIWAGRLIGLSLSSYLVRAGYLSSLSDESLYFAIPYATCALLIQAILGLHHCIVFTISLTIIVGIYTPEQTILLPYILCSCLVAGLSLSRFRSRSAYTKAGFYLILITLPFTLSSIIMDPNLTNSDIAFRFIGSIINGILCSSMASGITPIAEWLGGYVTDMRLIEMATLDHALLKDLSIQAPGTWNHSMVMGMMVESAANAIGANSVISRVGAYFHDIGKMKKPLYFVENQIGEENRHDKLSTSMSALIIRSHVKDGIELAKKHKLPQIIEDMIPQHHGTSLIEYFYDKANKEAKEGDENAPEVDASLYSYPGPKPQTKEAGILMLADGIEAAARSISDPTPDRIQGLVQKMMNKIFASGELNECELTLKDLHAIAKSFTHVLAGIYHQRIAYAEPAEKISTKTGEESAAAGADTTEVENSNTDPKQKTEASEKPDKEQTKEDLKRLGM
jgi:putative nucleotidyltransferase with HDIG domain